MFVNRNMMIEMNISNSLLNISFLSYSSDILTIISTSFWYDMKKTSSKLSWKMFTSLCKHFRLRSIYKINYFFLVFVFISGQRGDVFCQEKNQRYTLSWQNRHIVCPVKRDTYYDRLKQTANMSRKMGHVLCQGKWTYTWTQ